MRLSGHATVEVPAHDAVHHLKRLANRPESISAGLLLLSGILELCTSIGAGGRIFPLVAAWLVAERCHRHYGYATVALGLLTHALFRGGPEANPLVGVLLQAAVGLAIVHRVDWHRQHAGYHVHRASHDSLTGVVNRGTLFGYADRELSRCVSDGLPFTLAVLDCDRFKELNDVYGHAFGDEILKLLVKNVQSAIGSKGKLGRTGGDEFVVIFPGVGLEEADRRLARAAEAFGDATLILGRKSTISIGMAVAPEDGVIIDKLIERADEDMYRRKAERKAGFSFEISA